MNSSFWSQSVPEPQSPIDFLATERRKVLAAINLNSLSSYADGKGCVSWWSMFERSAREGAAQITSALQIYVTFLEPPLVEAATKLLNCFFMEQLQHIHEIVDTNTRNDPTRTVPFFWVSPEESGSGYDEFWQLVAEVTSLCTSDVDETSISRATGSASS